jgi:Na+-transporting NADH:ubiquinone oxidoreductase, subunit NqrF
VFNNKGEVIGIATFGSIDQNSGQEIQGMNFAVPVSIAKQFLNELNIKPAESALTKSYKSALALFHQDKYKKALKMFKDINDINPGYPYIQDYISQCSVNIDAGKDKSSDVTKYIIIGVIAFAAIGLIIAAVIILSRKFNFKIEVKSRTPAPDAESPQDPPQQ